MVSSFHVNTKNQHIKAGSERLLGWFLWYVPHVGYRQAQTPLM